MQCEKHYVCIEGYTGRQVNLHYGAGALITITRSHPCYMSIAARLGNHQKVNREFGAAHYLIFTLQNKQLICYLMFYKLSCSVFKASNTQILP